MTTTIATINKMAQLNAQLEAVEGQGINPTNKKQPIKLDLTVDKGGLVSRTYNEWLYEIENLQGESKNLTFTDKTQEANYTVNKFSLERQKMALQYSAKIGLESSRPLSPQEKTQFEEILSSYKADKNIYPGSNEQFTKKDQDIIDQTCDEYPEFVRALIAREKPGKHDEWTLGYVKFCLRSGLSVELFIKAPNETDALMRSHLDKRIGGISPNLLQFQTDADQGKAYLHLKMDGNLVNIHGDNKKNKCTLKNRVSPNAPGLTLKISDVFAQFKKKTTRYGCVEMTQEGVINWDTIHLGSGSGAQQESNSSIDFNDKNWLQNLPVVKSLSKEALQERYPDQVIPMIGGYGFALRASALQGDTLDENKPLDLLNTHGYWELITPGTEEGTFNIYPMGFQSVHIPENFIGSLAFLQETREGRVHYPDESGLFAPNRQHTGLLITLNQEEFNQIAEEIRKFALAASQGRKYFQMVNKNCAYYALGFLTKTLGEKYLYGPFKASAQNLLLRDISTELKSSIKTLDAAKQKALIAEVVKTAVSQTNYNEMNQLVESCLNTMNRLTGDFQEKFLIEDFIKSLEEQGKTPDQINEELIKTLSTLLEATFDTLQLFKTDLLKCNLNNGIEKLFNMIKEIPWRPVQMTLIRAFYFISRLIARFSTSANEFEYTNSQGQTRVANVADGILAKEGRLNLPAQIFRWKEAIPARIQQLKSQTIAQKA